MKRLSIITAIFLIAAALLAGCDTREQDWEAATQADSIAAYEEFLDQHPDGQYTASARERIAEIREKNAWDSAQDTGTVDAYQAFVEEYPDSEHAAQAAARIEEMERSSRWSQLRDSTEIAALEAFVRRYPDSDEAAQARERIEQLEAEAQAEAEAEARARAEAEAQAAAEAASKGDYRVQLAAYRSENAARAGAQRIQERYASLLGDANLEVVPPEQGSSYFRLLTSRLGGEEARNLCASLKEQGQDCLVVSA